MFYDSTFDGIYPDPSAGIDMSVNFRGARETTFVDSDSIMLRRPGRGYGAWIFYDYPRLMRGLQPAEPSRAVAFTGPVEFTRHDTDLEGLYDALVAQVEVTVKQRGVYSVSAGLYSHGKLIASRPSWHAVHDTRAGVPPDPGRSTVTLRFSGEAIFRSGLSGPYQIRAQLSVPGAKPLEVETPAYPCESFGEVDAAIHSVSHGWADPGRGGRYRPLLVSVDVDSREAESFIVQLSVQEDGQTLAASGVRCSPHPCPGPVAITVPGEAFEKSGADGPYLLSVELFSAASLESLDAWQKTIAGVAPSP
jgi:hypothetical protein